jgi:hypothetical protein
MTPVLITQIFQIPNLNSITTLGIFNVVVRDSFYFKAFDGITQVTVFYLDTDDCGSWNGGFCGASLPRVSLDISSYANPNCQVRFTYFDGNDWCWCISINTLSIT